MTLYRYTCFAPHITAFSTERGRIDTPSSPYQGFNINPFCGDTSEHVTTCRYALCTELGITDDQLFLPHQTHHAIVANIDRGDSLDGVDALMTSQRGLCIGVSTADCFPVLLHDTRHNAVCAVHSGWRGTVMHITAKALQAMQHAYGTRPQDLVAAIGPGIRLAAFEVGDEVYDAFRTAGFDINAIACRMPSNDGHTQKWHIDLALAIRSDLHHVPVIFDCGLCTHTMHHRFFSARRLGIHSGRIYTAICMA